MSDQQQKRTPAYRIETERLVLRCWQPEDAPLLKAAIDASLDHLRPWMPWVKSEPEEVAQKVARIRRWRGDFDHDKDYILAIFNPDETAVLGGTGLHTRQGKGALEIGYWVHAEHIGKGIATELSAALTKAGFEIFGAERMEIHCDERNVASANVPRKLGYVHEATRREKVEGENERESTMIWTMFRTEYEASPLKEIGLKAFDITGNQIL